MKRTPLKRKTSLKSKTPLKRVAWLTKKRIPLREGYKLEPRKVSFLAAHKPLNKVSKKQAKENIEWAKIKSARKSKLITKYGYISCELCRKWLASSEAEGHHNDHNRRNNTESNCRILCHNCNCFIVEDNNIKDVPDLLKD